MAAKQESSSLVTLASPQLWSLGHANGTGLGEMVGALSKLSTDELCALRDAVDGKLSHAPQRSTKVDFFALLPEELRVLVFQWLGPGDIWPCLQVSRRWRDVLLDANSMRTICRDIHPGLLEMVTLSGKAAIASALLDTQRRAFKETSLYSFLRQRGDVASVFFQRPWLQDSAAVIDRLVTLPLPSASELSSVFFRVSGELGSCPHDAWPLIKDVTTWPHVLDEGVLFGTSLYGSGRLVYQPFPNPWPGPGLRKSCLVVDDFATRTRRILEVPRIYGNLSDRLLLFCIGNSLVVARDDAHRVLAVWSLYGEPEFSLARLPRRIDQAATAGYSVVGTYRVGGVDDTDDTNGDCDPEEGMTLWRWTREGRGRVVERTLTQPADYATELVNMRRNCLRHVHSILIHPRDDNIIYLFVASLRPAKFTVDLSDPKPVTMAVFEITGEQISGRWKMEVHASWLGDLTDPMNFDFKPIDRHGSYFTATRQQEGVWPGTLCHEQVVFNIFTKKLTTLSSVVPVHSSISYGRKLLWDGKYITWQTPPQELSSQDILLPLVVSPALPSKKLSSLSPRRLTSVPCRSLPLHSRCKRCDRPAILGEGGSGTGNNGANHGDRDVETGHYSGLENHASLHETLAALVPRLDLLEKRPPWTDRWEELYKVNAYLTEEYTSMEACNLDLAMSYDAGVFYSFPGPLHRMSNAHIPLSSRMKKGFPVMWTDDRYLVFLTWTGYTVWEFRSVREESRL